MGDLEKGDKGSQSSTADKVSRPVPKPRSNCLLGFCRLINFLTAICCLLCAVAHGMALMVGEGSVQGVQALTQQVLRLYGVGFAMILGIQMHTINAAPVSSQLVVSCCN